MFYKIGPKLFLNSSFVVGKTTCAEYSVVSTIQGVVYIFDDLLPWIDRAIWTIVVLVSFVLSVYLSVKAYNNWQVYTQVLVVVDIGGVVVVTGVGVVHVVVVVVAPVDYVAVVTSVVDFVALFKALPSQYFIDDQS